MLAAMNELVAIPYSPWSEKARWALDHHAIPYRESEYTPMLSEPALRARLGKWRGKISIPILLSESGRSIQDSFAIAHHAEELSQGTPALFPAAFEAEIVRWNERSEAALAAGRALVTERVLQDPAAKREALPKMPDAAKALMTPIADLGAGFLRRKYKFGARVEAERRTSDQVFQELQTALEESGDYLVGGQFSYADICMATALQMVRPVTDEYIRLGPATRLAWTDDLLASKFPTLLAWRDGIYQKHRNE
jgi:glutathione S-transferase